MSPGRRNRSPRGGATRKERVSDIGNYMNFRAMYETILVGVYSGETWITREVMIRLNLILAKKHDNLSLKFVLKYTNLLLRV
jgi:hypothetical protein